MLLDIARYSILISPLLLESMNNLIELYDAWEKSEKAKEWREKLP